MSKLGSKLGSRLKLASDNSLASSIAALSNIGKS
jgi:hypothetical protein